MFGAGEPDPGDGAGNPVLPPPALPRAALVAAAAPVPALSAGSLVAEIGVSVPEGSKTFGVPAPAETPPLPADPPAPVVPPLPVVA